MLSQTGEHGVKSTGNQSSPSMLAMTRQIVKKEGVLGLWAGNGANLLRVFPAKAIVFSTNDMYKSMLCRVTGSNQANGAISFLAGGFAGGNPVSETTVNLLHQMLNINLFTAYNLSRAAVKPMIAQKWGRIVNTASRDALQGRANFSAYAMSKAALVRLTESMAAEVKAHNITVNAILPGAIDTEANREAMPKANFSKWVQPATIAKTLMWLVDENTATTGAAIPLFEEI